MNNKKKINNKVIVASLFLSSIIISFNSPKILATNINSGVNSDTAVHTSTVSTNMLATNSSIIIPTCIQKLEGKDRDIKVTFTNLLNIKEKLFAVLVDERAGGVFQSKFLDSNNSVEFKNILRYVSIPGIHLYKQSPTDKDFTMRKENFVASSSYLMPYVEKITNSGLITARKENAMKYGSEVQQVKLDSTTDPQIYSLRIPRNFFNQYLNNCGHAVAKNILAAVISYPDNNYDNTPLEVKQWVSTDYNETDDMCRFEFLVPEGTKDVQVHLYKDGLYEDKFICKFYIHLNEFKPT